MTPTPADMERARVLLNSFGLHPRTCGPTKARARQEKLAAALTRARAEGVREGVERAIEAAKAEPEAPGPMPETMIPVVLRDPECAMRAAVTSTKRGILNRLRALVDSPA